MSVDVLQEKIRKTKNPAVLELALPVQSLPPQYSPNGEGYEQFCKDVLEELKGILPAVRVSFTAFSLLGHDGLYRLSRVLGKAGELGYYVLLDTPELWSAAAAEQTAELLLGDNSLYPCDGLLISGYLGSDLIKTFRAFCKEKKKMLFVVTRTANKTAPELQDLLTGTRLVHAVAAEHINRFAMDCVGKCGYSSIAVVVAANAADSIRSLRTKHPRLFCLVDGYDYPNANAKNCSHAFDKFGHGAAVCSGEGITCAWKKVASDGSDHLAHARAAAEKMRKNLTRYTTVL